MASKHTWITVWIIVSSILVAWDAGYCFMRPRSFHGGDLHWIWKPYSLYQNIDLVYGVEAHRRGDGFTNAQSLLNVFEVIANLTYLFKTHISPDPVAPVIGLSAAIATFSKTVLYWAQEYYCNYCAVGHNEPWTLFIMWMVPNGAWLVFPGMIIWTLYKDIASSLRLTGAPARSVHTNGTKLNGKSH
ncbi:hypothetical protein M408DRAFT_329766 [Serendipita vermifera MAFF 305830]|uniref:EXPERA domain-containing protein n=1 Tax=Serendipita vermifera MAFF 305830 TaxID=933852 RepID=A0A0C2WNK5_SERVB|nr:hypothetical protein M408DRAFT_329766 [Serendipita vermifera MAFF 305830]